LQVDLEKESRTTLKKVATDDGKILVDGSNDFAEESDASALIKAFLRERKSNALKPEPVCPIRIKNNLKITLEVLRQTIKDKKVKQLNEKNYEFLDKSGDEFQSGEEKDVLLEEIISKEDNNAYIDIRFI